VEGLSSANLIRSEKLPFRLISLNKSFAPVKGGNISESKKQNDKKIFERSLKVFIQIVAPFYRVIRTIIENIKMSKVLIRERKGTICLYLHSYNYIFSALFMKMIFQIPYIYDAHDFYPMINKNLFWYNFMEWLSIKFANQFVTVGNGIVSLYLQNCKRKAEVIMNCHSKMLNNDTINIRKRLNLKKEDMLIVSVCRPVEGRATFEIIYALSELNLPIHLAFVGTGFDKHIEYVNSKKIQEYIHFFPPVLTDEVISLIFDSNLAFLPHYNLNDNVLNALPNGFFQSLAAEIPVLYSGDLVAISEICNDFKCGIPIDPTSIDSIKQCIENLYQNPEILIELKRNAHLASKKYCWENEEEKLFQLIDSVTS
jgi:glycosyltransferase involved in cell wall biosynthesis